MRGKIAPCTCGNQEICTKINTLRIKLFSGANFRRRITPMRKPKPTPPTPAGHVGRHADAVLDFLRRGRRAQEAVDCILRLNHGRQLAE
jgi:hypothetical protein